MGDQHNFELTIPQVVDMAAERFGGSVAVVEGDVRLSFEDVRGLSVRLAKHLLKLGIRKGDPVAVQLPNNWHYPIVHFALTRIGAVLTPLNLAYRQQELRYMLKHNEVKMVAVVASWRGVNHLDLVQEVLAEVETVRHVVVLGDSPVSEQAIRLETLLREEPDGVSDAELALQAPDLDDPFAILFTSGTQSDPKATVHTYRTFVPVHLYQAREYQFTADDVLLTLGSFNHMFSIPMMFSALHTGIRHVMLTAFSPVAYLEVAAKEGVTVGLGVPAQWLDILRVAKDQGVQQTLRLVVTGGSKIPPHMVHNLKAQFGCTVAAQWGMTEVCAGAYTRPDDPPEKSWETIGRACPEGEMKVLNVLYEEAERGEVGELAFRGPSLFCEYYKNPAATASAFTKDGFFLTGDLGWMDEQGFVHFVGRAKDTINRGGLKIYALEIEDLLLEHPAIRQVAVVRMLDDRLGERACAFVELTEGSSLTLEQMTEFLTSKGIAKYKLPERLEIRNGLPTTASGKVQKAKLMAELDAS